MISLTAGMARCRDGIASILAARWLGHGRAIECNLAMSAGIYGIILLLYPEAALDSSATADLAWLGYGQLLATPLLLKSFLTGSGLALNVAGMPYSRPCRFCGAMLGTLIWTFVAAKLLILGLIATPGFPFSLTALVFSVRIMGLSLADLPRPGVTGVL